MAFCVTQTPLCTMQACEVWNQLEIHVAENESMITLMGCPISMHAGISGMKFPTKGVILTN